MAGTQNIENVNCIMPFLSGAPIRRNPELIVESLTPEHLHNFPIDDDVVNQKKRQDTALSLHLVTKTTVVRPMPTKMPGFLGLPTIEGNAT